MSTKDTSPDPELEKDGPRFNPKKFFATQPQISIFVKRDESDVIKDPDNSELVVHVERINGHPWSMKMGYLNTVPLDFATQMILKKRAEPGDHAAYEAALASYYG